MLGPALAKLHVQPGERLHPPSSKDEVPKNRNFGDKPATVEFCGYPAGNLADASGPEAGKSSNHRTPESCRGLFGCLCRLLADAQCPYALLAKTQCLAS